MADVPRDPRQLARDILAGRVRIEDLARERQMRGGAPAPGLQAKIPAPRQVTPPRPPPMMPSVQRAPVRPVPRPMAPRPMMPQPPRPVQRPMGVPVIRQPASAPLRVTVAPPSPTAREIVLPEPLATARALRRPGRIDELVKSKRALRQGILLAEVLGKPVALRDDQQRLL
jgi:hypothetical protein